MQLQNLRLETRQIGAIVPFSGNARTHTPEQVAKIAASIKEFGFNAPILVDAESVIVAGHGRLAAAKSLGLSEVPVVVLGHLGEAERRAYTMADNRIALDAGWDEQKLAKELEFLYGAGVKFDLDLTGFTKKEIDRLLKGAHGGAQGRTEPDAVPPPAQSAVSHAGDTWLLGGHHRLRCGSSTDAAHVAALLEGEKPHLMVTDPPYGVDYDPGWRQSAGLNGPEAAKGQVLNDDKADWREAWALFPGHVAYVWHGGLHGATVQASLEACGFKLRAQIVWIKQRPVIGRGNYHWQHEPALYVSKDGADDGWQGERFEEDHELAAYVVKDPLPKGDNARWLSGPESRKQSTVWKIEHAKNDTGHGTQKPVECMRRPIVNNSRVGESVYEPFSGSGTTIVAAHIAGRRCFAMELNPLYVDVAVRRWQDYTGGIALLEGEGLTFQEAAAARSRAAA